MSDSPHLWNEIASSYDRTRAFAGAAESEVPRKAASLLCAGGARRVLDLGCGTGRFALPFAEAGLRVVAADRSAEMLGRLAAKPGAAGVAAVRCDAKALPFRRVFDAVFTSHVLHHFPSVERVADSVGRVLLPGGLLFDADTTYLPRAATSPVVDRVFPLLEPEWRPWPTGGPSRMLELLERMVERLGGGVVKVLPCAEWTVARTLRDVLADVRARTWATLRVHPDDRVLAAAAAAERALVAEGRDLDAPIEEREGVRFLVARLGSGGSPRATHA